MPRKHCIYVPPDWFHLALWLQKKCSIFGCLQVQMSFPNNDAIVFVVLIWLNAHSLYTSPSRRCIWPNTTYHPVFPPSQSELNTCQVICEFILGDKLHIWSYENDYGRFSTQKCIAPTLGEQSLSRNVSILFFCTDASNVGCSQPTVCLRQLGVFNIISWVLQNEQDQTLYHRTYMWLA